MNLWSYGRVHLHLTNDDFFALTPRQYGYLRRRHRNHVEGFELMLAQLTSWVANTGFRTTEQPLSTEDFMPSHWRKATRANTRTSSAPDTPMTEERRAEVATAMRGLFPPQR